MNNFKIGDLVMWDTKHLGKRYGIVIDKGKAIPSGVIQSCDQKDKIKNFISIIWTNGTTYKAYEGFDELIEVIANA